MSISKYLLVCSLAGSSLAGCASSHASRVQNEPGAKADDGAEIDEATVSFECTTRRDIAVGDEMSRVVARFQISGLVAGEPELVDPMTAQAEDELPSLVTFVPTSVDLRMINDEPSTTLENGRLTIYSNSIDLQYTTLTLYEDSDFSRGYLRVQFPESPESSIYTELNCTRSTGRR